MTTRRKLWVWCPAVMTRLSTYRATHGWVATVRWLKHHGLSLPLALLLAARPA